MFTESGQKAANNQDTLNRHKASKALSIPVVLNLPPCVISFLVPYFLCPETPMKSIVTREANWQATASAIVLTLHLSYIANMYVGQGYLLPAWVP